MSDYVDELNLLAQRLAFAQTGDPRFLAGVPKMGWNEPTHLPRPAKVEPRDEFDEWDDRAMRDCCGEVLAKPVQALLIALCQMQRYETWDAVRKAEFLDYVRPLLKDLRLAVKEEWEAL